MHRRTHIVRVAVGLMVGLAVAQSSQTALAAPQAAAAPTFGDWQERDMKTHIQVRPGRTRQEVVVTLPKEVVFPGSHQFLLTHAADGAYKAAEPGRPKIALTFASPSKARLTVRGGGTTTSGTWIAVNDFTLVRP